MQQVTPNIGKDFDSLDFSKKSKFTTGLFGKRFPQHTHSLSELPLKKGIVVIPDPSVIVESNYLVSTCECSHLISALKKEIIFDHGLHKNNKRREERS